MCPLVCELTKYTCNASVHDGTPIEGFEHFDWSLVGDEPFILKQLPDEIVNELDREDLMGSLTKLMIERKSDIEPKEYM